METLNVRRMMSFSLPCVIIPSETWSGIVVGFNVGKPSFRIVLPRVSAPDLLVLPHTRQHICSLMAGKFTKGKGISREEKGLPAKERLRLHEEMRGNP